VGRERGIVWEIPRTPLPPPVIAILPAHLTSVGLPLPTRFWRTGRGRKRNIRETISLRRNPFPSLIGRNILGVVRRRG
jgi:hypothetical protein